MSEQEEQPVVRFRPLGITTLAFLVLLVLKLVGLTQVSWWWVFFPLLLPWAVIFSVLLVSLALAVVAGRYR